MDQESKQRLKLFVWLYSNQSPEALQVQKKYENVLNLNTLEFMMFMSIRNFASIFGDQLYTGPSLHMLAPGSVCIAPKQGGRGKGDNVANSCSVQGRGRNNWQIMTSIWCPCWGHRSRRRCQFKPGLSKILKFLAFADFSMIHFPFLSSPQASCKRCGSTAQLNWPLSFETLYKPAKKPVLSHPLKATNGR